MLSCLLNHKKTLCRIMVGILSTVSIAGCSHDEPSNPTTGSQPASNSTVIEVGRRLAAACANCHGLDGAETQFGAPYVAGQRPDYLEAALRAYAKGDRRHAAMSAAVAELRPLEIVAVSAYYAAQKASWPMAIKTAPMQPDPEAIAAGQTRSSACAPCHGEDGHSTRQGVPSLAGLRSDYFRKALGDYLNDKRKNPLMGVFKHALSHDDIQNLTAYFTSLTPQRTTLPISGDPAKGKALAARRCSGCHGISGLSINPSIPNLFGHNDAYLANALKHYRDGARDSAMMRKATAGLTDDGVADIAAYYSSQTPVVAKTSEMADSFDPVAEGGRLSETCTGCHGEDGNSRVGGIPSLSGQPPGYLVAAISGYQNGSRNDSTMKSMVEHLTRIDIEKLAFYFSTRQPATSPASIKGDAQRGATIAGTCESCHGKDGNSMKAGVPSLAGQDGAYLAAAMKAYAAGRRTNNTMREALSNLGENDYGDIAAFFAAQKPVQQMVRLPESPEALARKCEFCHSETGRSAYPGRPRIAGQIQTYLLSALREYANSQRNNSSMYAMSRDLTEMEMEGISHYYAEQR